jgi:hypothetical protein
VVEMNHFFGGRGARSPAAIMYSSYLFGYPNGRIATRSFRHMARRSANIAVCYPGYRTFEEVCKKYYSFSNSQLQTQWLAALQISQFATQVTGQSRRYTRSIIVLSDSIFILGRKKKLKWSRWTASSGEGMLSKTIANASE